MIQPVNRTVLVVEPDAGERQQYEVMLARAGFSVVSAADGTSGLRVATRLVPDSALIELALPTLDGFHLARRLRRQPKTHDIGIVAVTAEAGEDLQRRAVESGIDTVVRKPVSMPELLRVIRETVRNSADLRERSARLRAEVAESRAEARDLWSQTVDAARRARRLGQSVERVLTGGDGAQPSADALMREAQGARDVLIVDRERGEQLFQLLFERCHDDPILHFARGEAYRAIGRRKLAHIDFLVAAERLPPGELRDRARLAAMRTRSHHERPNPLTPDD